MLLRNHGEISRNYIEWAVTPSDTISAPLKYDKGLFHYKRRKIRVLAVGNLLCNEARSIIEIETRLSLEKHIPLITDQALMPTESDFSFIVYGDYRRL